MDGITFNNIVEVFIIVDKFPSEHVTQNPVPPKWYTAVRVDPVFTHQNPTIVVNTWLHVRFTDKTFHHVDNFFRFAH
ncbi:hypothetical protein PAZH1_136 [Pseudomonas phage PA_ZH1]|nr:hypothetical protein PAZH1_136 [Pseudomonas phage PA_ZH1]